MKNFRIDDFIKKVIEESLQEKADELTDKIRSKVEEWDGQVTMNAQPTDIAEDDIEERFCNENSPEFDEERCEYNKRAKLMSSSNEIDEELHGNQKVLDKNKNNKIDAEDFKMLRKENESVCEKCGSEMKEGVCEQCEGIEEEMEEGNAFSGARAKAIEDGDDTFEVDGKTYPVKESKDKKFIQKAVKKMEKKGTEGSFKEYCGGEVTKTCIDKAMKSGDTKLIKKATFAKNIKAYKGAEHNKKNVKESIELNENEMIELIEKIVLEQKKAKGMAETEKVLKASKKENEQYIKDVTKKMKEYLKNGSKGEYSMEPKTFPKGNGELAKMDKKTFAADKPVEEYIDNFTAAGLENLVYDEIHPNEEWVTKNIEGSSETGNNPEWANAVETPVNKKRNKIRKDNLLGKIKRKAYNKAPQPIIQDKSGEDAGEKLMMKLESENPKNKQKLDEEFKRMSQLFSYDKKTQ